MMADTVMVTGGSGFIGSHLVKRLLGHGDKVVNYDIRPSAGDELEWMMTPYQSDIIYEEGGVENWPQLFTAIKKHKVNKIAHLAAPLKVTYLNRMPKVAFDVMVTGAVNLLEAVRLMEIERFVFFSSIGVLPTVQYEPIDCNHPTVMANEGPGTAAYGAGKLSGEAFCWAYHKSYDIDFVILRPSAAYGLGSRNPIYINQMVEGAVRGEQVHYDHGRDIPRDYTHVHDIAGIALAALNTPRDRLKQRTFYAATGRPLVTAGQVAEIVRDKIPSADVVIEPGLSFADTLEIKFRGMLAMKPTLEQLGYELEYTDVRDGIDQLIDQYREYLVSIGETPASRT
jgi:nucleoside-diphosphate-sugar epimerase